MSSYFPKQSNEIRSNKQKDFFGINVIIDKPKQEESKLKECKIDFKNSSAFYVILSYLSQMKILELQILSKKFYYVFVPTVLDNVGQGTVPLKARNITACKILPESGNLHMISKPQFMPFAKVQEEPGMDWCQAQIIRRSLKNQNGLGKQSTVVHNFGKIYWPRIVPCNPARNYVYVLGGLHLETNRVSKQFLEVNTDTQAATVMPQMPEPRFGHAAISLGEDLFVTGGIRDMSHDMGLRQVAMGHTSCFKFNKRTGKWKADMPELPIGKMYPTLVAVKNRFVFQIGGFDDYDFDIYCLDTQELEKGWMEIKLDLNVKVVRSPINQDNLFEFQNGFTNLPQIEVKCFESEQEEQKDIVCDNQMDFSDDKTECSSTKLFIPPAPTLLPIGKKQRIERDDEKEENLFDTDMEFEELLKPQVEVFKRPSIQISKSKTQNMSPSKFEKQ